MSSCDSTADYSDIVIFVSPNNTLMHDLFQAASQSMIVVGNDCPLSLNTKYYSGKVNVCNLCPLPITVSPRVCGVVLHVPQDTENDVTNLIAQLDIIDGWSCTPSLLLCVCHGKPNQPLLNWCVENGFELIDVEPDVDAIEEADENGEKVGIHRLLEALESHTWCGMELKSVATGGANVLGNICVDEDCEEDSFEQLFANFAQMKTQGDSLPPEERRAFAENVTMQFWKAIGGDDSEIELSDVE